MLNLLAPNDLNEQLNLQVIICKLSSLPFNTQDMEKGNAVENTQGTITINYKETQQEEKILYKPVHRVTMRAKPAQASFT